MKFISPKELTINQYLQIADKRMHQYRIFKSMHDDFKDSHPDYLDIPIDTLLGGYKKKLAVRN